MPIFWRYLLNNYLRVLCLSVISFISILLVSRLEEIAQFASIGAGFSTLFFFTLYQIPYILPIAIPISCLLSAILLMQKLSQTHELTALRASGFSLKTILAPLLIAGAFISFANFYITSEIATASHLATRKMIYEMSSVNPLILLQNQKIAKLKGAYVQMDPVRNGESAKDVVIALQGKSQDKIHLLIAKKLKMENQELMGKQVSMISSLPSASLKDFDHLMIENQKLSKTPAAEFARLLRNQGWKIAADHLKFSLLKTRIASQKELVRKSDSPYSLKEASKILSKCYTEIVRRLSFGFAPLTFTFLGAAFGMEISRLHSKRGILIVILLAALTLISFFIAKELDTAFFLAALCLLSPHVIMMVASFWTLNRINKGIE